MIQDWRIAVGNDAVSASYEAAATGPDRALFVCAHGAGGNKDDKGMLATSRVLRAGGFGVVRFNFLYREKNAGRPDQMPRLMQTITRVVEHCRAALDPGRLIIGGRSMGGRAASMLAANGFSADGLLLLAYPLHPPGKPEKLRDAHLPGITMPVLCMNGTRDEFCTRDLMLDAVKKVRAPWEMKWIESADHSFHVLKKSGRSDAEVMLEIGAAASNWLTSLESRG